MTSRDPEIWLWAEACELLERAERLQRQFFHFRASPVRRPSWEPPVDIFETQEAIWILIALPGVNPDQIGVGIDCGTLRVTGVRSLPRELRAAHIHSFEIPHGHFERRIELPPGRFEVDRRELINGCLTLSLRKLKP